MRALAFPQRVLGLFCFTLLNVHYRIHALRIYSVAGGKNGRTFLPRGLQMLWFVVFCYNIHVGYTLPVIQVMSTVKSQGIFFSLGAPLFFHYKLKLHIVVNQQTNLQGGHVKAP